MNRLHVQARLLRCSALAWECLELAAARVEVAAWERANRAQVCAERVLQRAEADA